MNATSIEWTAPPGYAGRSANPVTGCKHGCRYCYARRMAKRLAGRYGYPKDDPFAPTFHRDRLEKLDAELARARKPLCVFMVSMGDLFGDWVPWTWQAEVLALAMRHRRHLFQFLTKAPHNLARWNPWPENCSVGATVDVPGRVEPTLRALAEVEASVRFVSFEPLLGHVGKALLEWLERPPFEWAIIGAQTGAGAKPVDRVHALYLDTVLQGRRVPVFHKDNVEDVMSKYFRQEWPTAYEVRPVHNSPDPFEGWRLYLVLRGKCVRRQHDGCRAWEKVEKPHQALVITPAEAAQIEKVAAQLVRLYT